MTIQTSQTTASQASGLTATPLFAKRATALAAALGLVLAAAQPAQAMVLGRLTTQSGLGEPLRAEIDIPEITQEEFNSIRAAIASPEAFKNAGLEYSPGLANMQIFLQRKPDGRIFIRLAGDRPIETPFLNILFEANWSSGRVTRGFSVLLDPPSLRQNGVIAPVAPMVAAAPPPPPPPPAPAAALQPSSAPAPTPVAPAPVPVPPAPAPAAAVPAPVQSAPALTTTPANTTTPPQAAATPVRAEPAPPPAAKPTPPVAKAATPQQGGQGKSVRVARGSTAGKIARENKPVNVSLDQMLLALLRANPDAFIDGNVNRIKAGAVLNLPSEEEALSVSPTEARQVVLTQQKDFSEFRRKFAENAPRTTAQGSDRQATGKVETTVQEDKATAPNPDKLTLSKAASAQSKAADKTAEEKIAQERQAKDDATRVAELSKNIDDLNKLATGPAAPAPGTSTGSGAGPATGTADSTVPGVALPGAAAPATPAAASTAAAGPATADIALNPAAAGAGTAATASADSGATADAVPAQKTGFLDRLINDKRMLPLAGGLLALLAALGWYRSGQRKKIAAEQERAAASVQQEAPFLNNSLDNSPEQAAHHSADAGQTGTYAAPIPTPFESAKDIDPLAEADVYLDYGRDEEAEKILRTALATHHAPLAVHTKLLGIYAKRHDAQAYAALASETRALVHHDSAEWTAIRNQGLALDPHNALYHASASTAPAYDESQPHVSAAGSMMGFDLGNLSLDLPTNKAADAAVTSTADSTYVTAADPLHASTAALAASTQGDDPWETKLALAREFAAIGDMDGARTLVREVLAHASGPLKAKADALLADLG